MPNGTYVIVTGLSGAGKTTVVKDLLQRFPSAKRVVTTTTRQPRDQEVDGRDYHFLSRAEFVRRREAGEFLEWDEHYENLYGSSKVEIEKLLAVHPIVFGIVDVNGAMATKKLMPASVVIFLDVDDLDKVWSRIQEREGVPSAQLAERKRSAQHERSFAPFFDHRIVNYDGRYQQTVDKCSEIVQGHLFKNAK